MLNTKGKLSMELSEQLELLKSCRLPIIVEGKKDVAALKILGISNTIPLNGPLFQVVERISEKYKRAIILTDLDPEGRKLYSRLKRDLGERGVEIDDRFREFLFRKTKLRHIEGIDTYLENLDA